MTDKKTSSGGLYKNIRMSVRTADILVLVTAAILVFCFAFVVNYNGFVVTFETNGGTDIQPCKVMYGEKINVREPVKENCIFTGWYIDKDCSCQWDVETDTASDSITLYAGWTEK